MSQASWGTAPAGSEFQPVKVIVAVLAVWPHAEVVPVEFDPAEILRQILPARHIFIVENCVCFQIGSCNFIKVDCPRKITNQVVFLPELRKIKFQSLLFPVKILPFLLIEAGLPTDPFFVASKIKLISGKLYFQKLIFHLECNLIVITLNVSACDLRFLDRGMVIKEKYPEIMDHVRRQEIF